MLNFTARPMKHPQSMSNDWAGKVKPFYTFGAREPQFPKIIGIMVLR
jgi:hypothetical protein